MNKPKLVFKAIIQDAGVRVVEADSPDGRLWKCEIRWPRNRARKRIIHTFGLASTLTKAMVLGLVKPLIQKMQAEYGKNKSPMLSTMIDEFMDRHGATLKLGTREWYRVALRKALGGIGNLTLSEITPNILERFKSQYVKTAVATNNSLQVLHTMFEKAILWGYTAQNPVRLVPDLKVNPPRARMFTDEERSKLLRGSQSDPSPYIYKFVLWQLNTGMRPSESLGIKEPDVDMKHGRVRLGITKSNHPRYVSLSKEAQDIAWGLWHGDGGFLFRGAMGQPLTLDAVERVYRRVVRKVGVKLRLYDCRHDAISRWAEEGASVPVIQNLAGHRSLAITNLYLHFGPNHSAQSMEAVQRAEVKGIGDNVVTTLTTNQVSPAAQVVDQEGDLVTAGSGGGDPGEVSVKEDASGQSP